MRCINALLMGCLIGCVSCGSPTTEPEVLPLVVYTSQDQVYAETIFQAFTEATGIEVKPRFDNESAKTMGLAKRLLAEQVNPICDVFWSNESMAARKLAEASVVQGFKEFGHRARVMIINTNHVTLDAAPKSIQDLVLPAWKGKSVMAYPVFGTTATHMLALREEWGAEPWESWCRGLVENEIKIVDGNSMVVRMVGAGEAWVGLTDSDDLAVGWSKELPLASVPLKNELCAIPNTVALVQGGPNPEAAMQFIDFIRQETVLQEMVDHNALISAQLPPSDSDFLFIFWPEIMAEEAASFQQMREIFIR